MILQVQQLVVHSVKEWVVEAAVNEAIFITVKPENFTVIKSVLDIVIVSFTLFIHLI